MIDINMIRASDPVSEELRGEMAEFLLDECTAKDSQFVDDLLKKRTIGEMYQLFIDKCHVIDRDMAVATLCQLQVIEQNISGNYIDDELLELQGVALEKVRSISERGSRDLG